MSKYSVRIKVKKRINAIPAGAIVNVPINQEGTPLDFFWRKIFKDSKIDDCVEILDEKHSIDTQASQSSEPVKVKKAKAK